MVEYYIISAGGGKILDAELDEYAAEGWRVVSVSWEGQYIQAVLLERPAFSVPDAVEGLTSLNAMGTHNHGQGG